MFIQTESTPNPKSLKFIPGCTVMPQGQAEFRNAQEAEISPLAAEIFLWPGVVQVFYGSDFITVTQDDTDWSDLKHGILGMIQNQMTSNRKLFTEGEMADITHMEQHDGSESEKSAIEKIKNLLDTRVRPAIAQDGGDATFHSFRNGVLRLTLRGACVGCPSASMTLKLGIQRLMQHYIPEVQEVQEVL